MNTETLTLLGAILFGLLEAVRQYKTTGRLRLLSLPLRSFKRLIYELRRTFFTHPAKNHTQAPVSLSLGALRIMIGEQSYELEWPLSYRYEGEDLNARRYYYDPENTLPHRQVHIRAWETENGVEIYAHEEPSPIQHPVAHLKSADMVDVTNRVVNRLGNPNGLDPRGIAESAESGS